MNTLFMLMSLDGKISTVNDFDVDLESLPGIEQYYNAETEMAPVTFITAKTLQKIGVGKKEFWPETEPSLDVTCIVWETYDHQLTSEEQWNLQRKFSHIRILSNEFEDLAQVFAEYDEVTLQAGATANSLLFKYKMVDEIDIFIAPIIVGGEQLPTLVGGVTLPSFVTLTNVTCKVLEHNFLRVTAGVSYPESE